MKWFRGRRRLHLHRRIIMLAALQFALNWNPWTWYQEAANEAGRIERQLQDWVTGIILSAANLLENDTLDLLHWAGDRLTAVVKQLTADLNWVTSYAEALSAGVQHWAVNEINDVRSTIAGYAHTAEAFARSIGDYVIGWAQARIDQVGAWLSGAIKLVEDTARTLVREAIDLGKQYALDVWNWGWANIIQPVLAPLLAIKDDVAAIIAWFRRDMPPVFHAASQALGWLIWFAEHPIDGVEGLESDAVSAIRDMGRNAFEGAINRWGGMIERKLGDYFGVR